MKKDGDAVELGVFSFVTTTPNKLVAKIDHKPMPVILTKEEEFQTSLNGTPAEAYALVRQCPPEQMCIVQEGFEKKNMLVA